MFVWDGILTGVFNIKLIFFIFLDCFDVKFFFLKKIILIYFQIKNTPINNWCNPISVFFLLLLVV